MTKINGEPKDESKDVVTMTKINEKLKNKTKNIFTIIVID